MSRGHGDLLLGEWACLGILCAAPAHGFAVAARLRPDADVGRVWSLSRALTYRCLDQLVGRGLVAPVRHEPGIAGGTRTVLAATPSGRAAFRRWLRQPVVHLRDLRSELLLKIVLADVNSIDLTATMAAQRSHIADFVAGLDTDRADDVVQLWRLEAATAALRFVDRWSTLRSL